VLAAAAGTVTVVPPATETVGVGPEAVALDASGPTSTLVFVSPADAVVAAAAGDFVGLFWIAGAGPEPVAAAAAGLFVTFGSGWTAIVCARQVAFSDTVNVPGFAEAAVAWIAAKAIIPPRLVPATPAVFCAVACVYPDGNAEQ
jgi:hypothetical protein